MIKSIIQFLTPTAREAEMYDIVHVENHDKKQHEKIF